MSNQPPIEVPQGAIRLNTDSQKLEFYAQDRWYEMATETSSVMGSEAFFTAGGTNKYTQTFNMVTGGTAVDTGLSQLYGVHGVAAVSSKTRGVTMGGRNNPSPYAEQNYIQFFEFATKGDYQDFGDLTESKGRGAGHGNNTRGIMFGRQNGTSNVIEFITIPSKGNGTDFGDSLQAREMGTAIGNKTRACYAGGNYQPSDTRTNIIEYVTIATTGNAIDFGDELETIYSRGPMHNSIRGLMAGGYGGTDTRISFITIPTLGNAQEFGDLNRGGFGRGGTSSPITGVTSGGTAGTTDIEKVTLATLGNSTDFGDLIESATYGRGMSASHGGL